MDLKNTLYKYFGYENFRTGQLEIIQSILSDKNVLAILPTGGGKSICYQIPALISDNFSIVISPLIALMKDQVDSLNKNEKIAAFINSSMTFNEIDSVLNSISNNMIKLLYVSPERLENQIFAEKIKRLKPEYIFVDEAHCISEWGHSFRPSYRKIKNFCEFIDNTKIHAFTATATNKVRKDVIDQLNLKNPIIYIKGFERNNLNLNVISTNQKKSIVSQLLKKHLSPAIIYCSTRKEVESLYDYLNSSGFNCSYYHAGLSSEMRKLVQDDFINDRVKTIIATNAFGMGIDKSDIRLIIHYNIPGTIENYYQEIGRAGRDGKTSDIYLFYSKKDKFIQEFLIKNSYPNIDQIKITYNFVCDYGQVPIGIIPPKAIPLDNNFFKVISKLGINKMLALSAIQVLEESGYFTLSSNLSQNYYFKFNADQKELKKFIKKINNSTVQEILITLVRTYSSSPFYSKQNININHISEQTGLDKSSLIEYLGELNNIGIIEFEKPLNDASIMLKRERIQANHLSLVNTDFQEKIDYNLGKLNEMIEFTETQICRTNFILKYFGEINENYKCGHCDNCSSVESDFSSDTSYIEEKLLHTIYNFNQEIPKKKLLEIVMGKDSNNNLVYEDFDSLSNYSIFEIETALDVLLKYNEIKLNNDEIKILANGLKRINKQEIVTNTQQGYENRLILLNKLDKRRKEIAKKFNQSPNLICSDELLNIICEKKPVSKNEFYQIPEINERKFNKFGEDFLEIIKQHTLQPVSTNQKYNDIIELIEKKYSLEDIAKILKYNLVDLSNKIELILKSQNDISINHFFTKEEYKIIENHSTNNSLFNSELNNFPKYKIKLIDYIKK